MSMIIRLSGPGAFNNRPVRSSRDVRARAEPAKATGGVPSQGGMPIWCIPMLLAAAAAPIYGYKKCQDEIATARKKYEDDAKAVPTKAAKKA